MSDVLRGRTSTTGAVRLRTVTVLNPHVVLDDRLVSGTAELDVERLRQQRSTAALLPTSAAVLGSVVFHAQTAVVL